MSYTDGGRGEGRNKFPPLKERGARKVLPCFEGGGGGCSPALKYRIFLCELSFTPIFHWKLNLRYLTNTNEIDTNNMKLTWSTPAPWVGGWRWGKTQILAFALGVTQIVVFLNTNMLVSPTRNCGVGGLSQCEDPRRMVLHRSGIKAIRTDPSECAGSNQTRHWTTLSTVRTHDHTQLFRSIGDKHRNFISL